MLQGKLPKNMRHIYFKNLKGQLLVNCQVLTELAKKHIFSMFFYWYLFTKLLEFFLSMKNILKSVFQALTLISNLILKICFEK